MKQFMKINLLVLFALSNISSNSFGMWQKAQSRFATAMKPALNRFTQTQQAAKIIPKAKTFSTKTLPEATPHFKDGLAYVASACTLLLGGYLLYQLDHPEFTADNIDSYHASFVPYFTRQAIQNADSTDPKKRKALERLCVRDPIFVADTVVTDIDSISIPQLDAIYESLIKISWDIVIEVPFDRVEQERKNFTDVTTTKIEAATLKKYGTPDPNYIIEFGLRGNPLKKSPTYPLLLIQPYIYSTRDGIAIPHMKAWQLDDYIQNISIDNINWLYANQECLNSTPLRIPQKIFLQLSNMDSVKKNFFGAKNETQQIAFDDIVTLACLQGIQEAKFTTVSNWYNKKDYLTDLLVRLAQRKSLQMPYFMYKKILANIKASPQLLDNILNNIHRVDACQLNCLYDFVFINETDRQKIKAAALAHFGRHELVTFAEKQHTVPHFVFGGNSLTTPETITDHHYISHERVVKNNILKHATLAYPEVNGMFTQADAKQREEQRKGNYLFYHGRMASWDFFSDLYKQAYNVRNPHKKVGNDYVFLRFDSNSKTKFTRASNGGDALWMNASLYGNATREGSCTAQYVLQGSDLSGGPKSNGVSSETIFAQMGLEQYHAAYGKELKKLEDLHAQANLHTIGNLLAISLPEKELSRICIPQLWLSSWRSAGMIKSKQINDNHEFVLPLTADYALDPHKGPRIYSFNAADPEKYKAYEQYRDQLFTNIARDIQTGTLRSGDSPLGHTQDEQFAYMMSCLD